MNKEDQIFDLLERLYIELQDTKKELKEDISNVRTELKEDISNVRTELKEEISNVRTELKEEISNVRTELKEEISNVRIELKEDIKILNDNQMILFDKLEKIGSDVEIIKEDLVDIQSITASNYRDIIRLKAVK
jgi:gas vesicle protein